MKVYHPHGDVMMSGCLWELALFSFPFLYSFIITFSSIRSLTLSFVYLEPTIVQIGAEGVCWTGS